MDEPASSLLHLGSPQQSSGGSRNLFECSGCRTRFSRYEDCRSHVLVCQEQRKTWQTKQTIQASDPEGLKEAIAQAASPSSAEDEKTKDGGVTWTKSNTLRLIAHYRQRKNLFSSNKVKKMHLWVEISKEMKKEGNDFSPSQCEGRWKTLTAAYRRNLMYKRAGKPCASFVYFDEVAELYSDRTATSSKNPTVDSETDVDADVSANVVSDDFEGVEERSEGVEDLETFRDGKEQSKHVDHAGKGLQDLVNAVDRFRQEYVLAQNKKMDVLQRMHSEKVQLLQSIAQTLQSLTRK